jgi:hypothetical protein
VHYPGLVCILYLSFRCDLGHQEDLVVVGPLLLTELKIGLRFRIHDLEFGVYGLVVPVLLSNVEIGLIQGSGFFLTSKSA